MECRDKSAVPPRKLIQARLPFKRLNPVPKEKPEASAGIKKARNSQHALNENLLSPALSHPSPDNTENDCQEVDIPLVAPLVNGKGPLDIFVQKSREKPTGLSPLVTDLSKDPGHRLSDLMDPTKLDSIAASAEKSPKAAETQPGLPPPVLIDDPGSGGSGAADRDELLPEAKSQRNNVIFERKMPVVILEDIMVARSPQGSALETSLPSGSEAMELSQGEEKAPSDSSFSSVSPATSPESLPPQEQKDISPVAASTPVGKTSQKIHRRSEEREKLRLQKELERAEKGRLKEEAKAAKERAREEAKRKKDEERREKKEKDEKEKAEKLRAKEEKRKERQEALEAKQEEKRKKEEEKRLKEEEKRLKEEEKRIKAEKAEITRFFQKPKTQTAPKTLAGWCGKFAPFEIKENMVLAPQCRVAVDPDQLDHLDRLLESQDHGVSFLEELKSREPCKSGPTLLGNSGADTVNSDVVIVGGSQAGDIPDRKKLGRMKLLQFCENHRPAYWGTWNKASLAIRPRNPWSKDENLLDYEVESDEEWEEEEPGESLSHSEGDDDEDGGEEEDEDDGFFVPHGYLSEDEGVTEDCDPENHKARQRLKAKEWDELITKGKRFRVLQPVKIGCLWEGREGGDGSGAELRLLQQFAACVLDSSVGEDQEERGNKKKIGDEQILEHLLPLLHGNVNGSKVIIHEFQECCRQGLFPGVSSGSPLPALENGEASPAAPPAPTPVLAVPSKARLKRIISENSVYEKRPEHRMCWYVHPEVLKAYRQEKLPVPCQWSYVTQAQPVGKEEVSCTGSMSITKFMKRHPGVGQAETSEMDGFQADTEEEDDDCIIVDVQMGQGEQPRLGNRPLALGWASPSIKCPQGVSYGELAERLALFLRGGIPAHAMNTPRKLSNGPLELNPENCIPEDLYYLPPGTGNLGPGDF